ncbi:MAG: tRNA pseudouridine(55) synthase TruB [Caldilineaceae bacterium]
MPKREQPLDGLLIVDKPGQPSHHAPTGNPGASQSISPLSAGVGGRLPTSHDVVQMVRRWSGQRQIGHTGTLDPLASGVLVLCLGKATRLVEYYQGQPKQYYAEIILGRATDTYDAIGEISATAAIPTLDRASIETVLEQFRGTILQTPPAYSALKQGGESLHLKARRGEAVELTPRPITFYQLALLDFAPPDRIVLRALCSAGTYIRSLAHDLGLALQTVAHLAILRREAVGRFTLADAHALAAIESAAQQARLADLLLPLGYGLDMLSLELDQEQIRRLGQGQKIAMPSDASSQPQAVDMLARGDDASGVCVGILRCLEPATSIPGGFVWKAEKWFAQS